MTPSPTNSAIAAAAKEIVGGLGAYAEAFQLDWPPNRESYTLAVSDIIARHVEPIVRAVEKERDAATVALDLTRQSATKQALEMGAQVKAALTRAEQSEALLREAHWIVAAYAADHPKHTTCGAVQDPMGAHELSERIDNHFAPKGTT